MTKLLLLAACLLALQHAGQAATIQVGGRLRGWTLGVAYEPIDAVIGDELVSAAARRQRRVGASSGHGQTRRSNPNPRPPPHPAALQAFSFTSGLHDVWLLPSPDCDFEAAGAMQLSAPNENVFNQTLLEAGTFYYSCSITGHCQAGQLLTVNVAAFGAAPAPASDDAEALAPGPAEEEGMLAEGPAAGPTAAPAEPAVPTQGGECGPPLLNPLTGFSTVSCLSPGVTLSPGDNVYPDLPLPSPYPANVTVELSTVSGQMVDATGRAVPLEEVYLHHTFGDYRFVPAEGAEVRHSPMRVPLPAPYALVLDTADFMDETTRYINMHVINTVGVRNVKPCIECWCVGSEPPTGSIGCCTTCETNSTASPKDYFFQYNVTFRVITPAERAALVPIVGVGLDLHGERSDGRLRQRRQRSSGSAPPAACLILRYAGVACRRRGVLGGAPRRWLPGHHHESAPHGPLLPPGRAL
jgi:hypothetical protein